MAQSPEVQLASVWSWCSLIYLMIVSAKKLVVWEGKAFVNLAAGISCLWGGENAYSSAGEVVVRLAAA